MNNSDDPSEILYFFLKNHLSYFFLVGYIYLIHESF